MRDELIQGEVVGFRAWKVVRDRLMSVSYYLGYIWQPGINEAMCNTNFGLPHTAPSTECVCGLYAFFGPGEIEALAEVPPREGDAVIMVGIVKAWGRLKLHQTGFRAQYMQVVALGLNKYCHLALSQSMGRKYDCEVVPVKELRDLAPKFGILLPSNEGREVAAPPRESF